MTAYKYTQLDNRPTAEARAHNEAIFASGAPVWGIEVTTAEWRDRCEVDIDPQHGQSRSPMPATGDKRVASLYDPAKAACEVAVYIPLPPAGTTLLIERADLDAFLAAAILEHRADIVEMGRRYDEAQAAWRDDNEAPTSREGFYLCELERVSLVTSADNSAVGKTPWQRGELPTLKHPWPGTGSVDPRRELAAINRAVQDRSVPLEQRVGWVKTWLLTGQEPTKERRAFVYYAAATTPDETREHGEVPLEAAQAEVQRLRDQGHSAWYDEIEFSSYREEVERERQEVVEALTLGQDRMDGNVIRVVHYGCYDTGVRKGVRYVYTPQEGGLDDPVTPNVAAVYMPGKPYPGATGLGFAVAPATICVADHFQPGDYRKITIASWGVMSPEQMEAIRDRLNALESIPDPTGAPADRLTVGGWGGNLTSGILGSPQGRSTAVTVEQILDAMQSALKGE